jgi:signal transduction histidine kinase
VQQILKYVDWFIPAAERMDRSALGQHRAYVFTHLCGPLLGQAISAFLYGVDRDHGLPYWTIALGIAAFWLYPILLRFTGKLQLVALLSMNHLALLTLYGSYHYGGLSSPFLPWLLVALLLGFFYLGRYPGVVLGAFSVNVAGFAALYFANGDLPDRIPLDQLSAVGLISVLGATVYMSWMGVYYAHVLSSESDWRREAERHRNTEEQLRLAKQLAEEASRARSVFVAKMSHELRTPLNAVIGYSEILLEDARADGRTEQVVQDLSRINTAGKHLLALVNDVLDLSQIEANNVTLQIEPVEFVSYVRDVVATAEPVIVRNGNRLELDTSAAFGLIQTDPTKLRQVILNLLSNAGKFTADGVVTVTARRDRKAGDWIEIQVRDTGIGISKTDLPKLFRNFVQIGRAKSASGGTGLGLALSQMLCAKMGGNISVESEEGRGSCFVVRIPAILSARADEADAEGAPDSAAALAPALS